MLKNNISKLKKNQINYFNALISTIMIKSTSSLKQSLILMKNILKVTQLITQKVMKF